jgi:hypothetical protein
VTAHLRPRRSLRSLAGGSLFALACLAAAGLLFEQARAMQAQQAQASQPANPPASTGARRTTSTTTTTSVTPATPVTALAPKSKAASKRPAAGQAAPPAAAPSAQRGQPAAPPASRGSTVGGAPPPDMGNIDQILEGDEDVLSGNGFTYDPGNRRDPFKSLLIAADKPEFRGPRPEGIPGLLIEEIDLKGIYRTSRGYVAQVNAANQKKSYLLKEGDQLYDGDVVSIGRNEVVFKQIVQDPTALKPFREVVKSLTPQ